MNKKSLGAVVATALLIVVSVLAVIGFQTWFQTYSSQIQTNVEVQNFLNNINILDIVGDKIYLKSKDNFFYNKISIKDTNSNFTCNILQNTNLSVLAYWSFENYNSTHIFDLIGGHNGTLKMGVIGLIQSDFENVDVFSYPYKSSYDYFANTNDYYNGWILEITSGDFKGEKKFILDYNVSGSIYTFKLNSSINLNIGNEFKVYYPTANFPEIKNGVFGNDGYFDGVDDCIYIPNTENLQINYGDQKSLAFWFKAGEQSKIGSIFFKESGCVGYQIQIETNGKIKTYYKVGTSCSNYVGYNLESSLTYDDDVWHHLVLIFDRVNENIKLYIDTKLVGETSILVHSNADTSTYIKLGNSWNYYLPYNGSLDEIIFFNKTLNEVEINNLYNSSLYQSKGISSVDISSCNLIKNKVYEFLLTSNSGVYSKEFYYD